ncbi:MAG: hypothetical protein ACRELY_06320 [Polyangiaceae bacterium]
MRRLRVLALETPHADPREEMAALAAVFPGALREIDELPLEEIDARLASLSRAQEDPATAEPWMRAVIEFHELTRGALALKKWLSGRKTVTRQDRADLEKIAASLPDGPAMFVWIDDLHAIAQPPRGKITDLVFRRLAETLEISETEARALVFTKHRVA